ncbi:MAG: tRNA-dihydrouridine synthase family protein [Phycisphaerales bacterium]|nr:tRNA-dihydrouridine synthase family protein [Phycisphaerales bacterium]
MSCESHNATPPSPAVAPGAEGIDPARVASEIGAEVRRTGGFESRVSRAAPGFDAPFFQAGLCGYSDAAMRIVARRHGCPFCVTEALLDRTLLAGGKGFAKADLGELHDNVPGGDEDHPLAGQIMGSDPGEMAAAALKMLEQRARGDRAYRDLAYETPGVFPSTRVGIRDDGQTPAPGANRPGEFGPAPVGGPSAPDRPTFEVIDINLACPVKKVAAKARGGHWLAEPEGAIAILEAVRRALPARVPLSVKLRRSYDDTPAMARAFSRVIDAAFDLGFAWATVHARSVQQKYIGPSRWDLLRAIVQARPGRVIFGSGDVWEARDIFRMIAYTGVRAVSVARGCIGNPWIFRQARDLMAGREARPPTLAEQRRVLEEHFSLALAVNDGRRDGEGITGRTMRKFGIKFAAFHPRAAAVKARMIGIDAASDWQSVIEEFYGVEGVPA